MFSTKLREEARGAIAAEAAALGMTIRAFEEVGGEERRLGDAAGQIMRMAVTGSAPAQTTSVDLWWIDSSVGLFLLAQPFQAGDALVGEYHLRIEGGLPQPIVLARAMFFRKRWATADDKELSAALEGSAALKAATKKLAWAKHTTSGQIDLDWTVQLRALGDGTSHLVMQAGSSAWSVHAPALGVFTEVVLALAPLLKHDHFEAQGSYFDTQFEDTFFSGPAVGDDAADEYDAVD
jgi:hypothetical protein